LPRGLLIGLCPKALQSAMFLIVLRWWQAIFA